MTKYKNISYSTFSKYGVKLSGFDFSDICEAALKISMPAKGVVYERSIAALEQTNSYTKLKNIYAGEQDIQAGMCWGYNKLMNAVEYHRSSEINIAVTDMLVMLGDRRDIKNNTYESSLLELFLIPAGTAVEFYATTLHYAPCSYESSGFRAVIILPRGTNAPLTAEGKARSVQSRGENRLLVARDKWLIAHQDTDEVRSEQALAGIIGENICFDKE